MKRVEIFKTNVNDKKLAKKILEILHLKFPDCRINFDLDDCDNVLRIEGDYLQVEHIPESMQEQGFICEIIK